MKNILGLDLGTNSIGWAVLNTEQQQILGAGSRIIPMDAGSVGDFEKGNLQSSVADRRQYRMTRRMIERVHQRRSRLHRVLHVLGFLPEHYDGCIDFENHLGDFIDCAEPLLPYRPLPSGKREFIFMDSFGEMLEDFRQVHPELLSEGRKVPYDWTLYYLRKKALSRPIKPQELAWILLNFNTKRGYYQLRGMDDGSAEVDDNKEFKVLKVVSVTQVGPSKRKSGFFDYLIQYDNGAEQPKTSSQAPYQVGDVVEAICTTTVDKSGVEKISVSIPSEGDWMLRKKKTESDILQSHDTVGTYIYDHILRDPDVKVRGKLVHTIERRFYREELTRILEKQKEFIPELTDKNLLKSCAEELYRSNRGRLDMLESQDFTYLFVNDLIFYQRPLKSKKSLISDCPFETRHYVDRDTGEIVDKPVKCLPKSHPLFQEFRLWQFISNLRIYEREAEVNGKLCVNVDVTSRFLSSADDYCDLFDALNARKDIKQETFLAMGKWGIPKADRARYRWNYPEDKTYPCNVTLHTIPKEYRGVFDEQLWHILYSVTDMEEIVKALRSYAEKKSLEVGKFVESFRKVTFVEEGYAAYSAKAIRKLLPLMRLGRYWSYADIDEQTRHRIQCLCECPEDDCLTDVVRRNCIGLTSPEHFQGLPLFRASYVVYGRHSESADVQRWESPEDVANYLKNDFKQNSLRNPVVEKVVTETLRVVKDVWQTYGKIDEIHVEMARNLKQDKKGRERDYLRNASNEAANYRARVLLNEFVDTSYGVEGVHPHSPYQLDLFKIFEREIIDNYSDELKKDKQVYSVYRSLGNSSQSSRLTHSDILRYRLWLEQKYLSPYTGQPIPLSKLFTTAYEIEHVIPQSRYYDNSVNNKVICESEVNKDKSNMTGYEYILKKGGSIVPGLFGKQFTILSRTAYEELVKRRYWKNPAKMRILLMDDIPEDFTHRDMNDTRYMSRMMLSLLSKAVRDEDEMEVKSKHVIPTNGVLTTRFKSDWGINDVWNEIIAPRFQRMNAKEGTQNWGEERTLDGKRFFQTNQPIDLPPINKKRIDHRHHAMDAIVIACATWNHLTYMSSVSARDEKEGGRYDLKHLLIDPKTKCFKKPWPTFTQDVREVLNHIVVSFKQNVRVLTHLANGTRSVRKPLHKETYSGKVRLQQVKSVKFKDALADWHQIKDKTLRSEIKRLIEEYQKFDIKLLDKYFKDRKYQFNGCDVHKVDVYALSDDQTPLTAHKVALDASFDEKKIATITDSGIRAILLRHLHQPKYEDAKGRYLSELAFSPEGLAELNAHLSVLNQGRAHKPIYKVRLAENLGMKFPVGQKGVKAKQWVEAAKNTNLFFAVYRDAEKKRSYETIPLKVVVDRLKEGEPIAPSENAAGDKLLFTLSPNDLVYLPQSPDEELSVQTLKSSRIYKMVSCTKKECFFVPYAVAAVLCDKKEYGSLNKIELTDDGVSIKSVCFKLQVNRLGHITKIIGL